MTKWQVLDVLPDSFFECPPDRIHEVFSCPTLIHLKGKKQNALMVSTLLHGNETTGLFALQNLLKAQPQLPRDLLLFIGNVQAARVNQRHLENQPDYNRIWGEGTLPEHQMTQAILSELRTKSIDLVIDIHNTTGTNPLYVAARELNRKILLYGELFSRHVVHYLTPEGTFVEAIGKQTPAFVIECGLSGHHSTQREVANFLKICLTHEDLLEHSKHKPNVQIYQSIAKIKLIPDTEVLLDTDFDLQNFVEMKAGKRFCRLMGATKLLVLAPTGEDLFDHYFESKDDGIYIKTAFVPSLLTKDPVIYHSDALGYVMKSNLA